MKLYNLGRSFIITGIIELILTAIYYTYGLVQGANELSYFSYFCLIVGTLILLIPSKG